MAVVGVGLERGLLSVSVTTGTHTCLHTRIYRVEEEKGKGKRERKPVTHSL